MNLDLYRYIYLIGAGGIGMSALGRYFNSKGKEVYGYDRLKTDLCFDLVNAFLTLRFLVIPPRIISIFSNNG